MQAAARALPLVSSSRQKQQLRRRGGKGQRSQASLQRPRHPKLVPRGAAPCLHYPTCKSECNTLMFWLLLLGSSRSEAFLGAAPAAAHGPASRGGSEMQCEEPAALLVAGADKAALLPVLPRAGLYSEAAWCRIAARAGLGCPCKPRLPPTSMGLRMTQPRRNAWREDMVDGGNGAARAEPAALGGDPPAKLISDRLEIQNASEGALTLWQMPAGGKGCPGRAEPDSRLPSTLDLSLASLAAGGKLRHSWWRGSPHTQLGPAACWCQSPLPAPGFAEGSRQQPQLCPQTGAGMGRGVTDRRLEARAAGGCCPRVPVSPRGSVPSQSCRLAAASSAPCPGAGSRGSAGRQGHSTWEGPCWAAPGRGLSQHHQPQRVLLPL